MTLTSSSRNSQCALIQQQLLNLILTKMFFNYFVEQPMLVAEFLIASLALIHHPVISDCNNSKDEYFVFFLYFHKIFLRRLMAQELSICDWRTNQKREVCGRLLK